MSNDAISKDSNHEIFRSHDQVTERLKELTAKPPRPSNPPAVVNAQKSTANASVTNTPQHDKQLVNTQAELLYQITEG